MTPKVDVLLPNSSQYEVLHHFARKVYEALGRLGYEARLLSRCEYTETLFSDPPLFTIGFNGAPIDEEGEFLCDKALVPHIACLVDPPYRFLSLQSSPFIFVTCDDRVCVDFFKSEQHPHYYFLPHGVEKELSYCPAEERVYDAVFLGSSIDPERHRLQWHHQFPEFVWKTMEASAEAVLADGGLHFMQAFLHSLNQAETLPFSTFSLAEAFQELELYLKARDRIALIKSIKCSRVDVFGGNLDGLGWRELLAGQSNVVIHPSVSYGEAIKIMQRSKIVLHSGIKSGYGAHERIFSGLAAGAAVLATSNPFLSDHFEEGTSILLYNHQGLDRIDEKVHFYLKNEARRQSLAEEGRHLAMRDHTWDRRLSLLLPQLLPIICRLRV